MAKLKLIRKNFLKCQNWPELSSQKKHFGKIAKKDGKVFAFKNFFEKGF